VTTVVNVPPSLDESSFEQILEQVATLPRDARILVDARHTRWASPFGLTGLLALAQSRGEKAAFAPPEADDTLSYWARTGFFTLAADLFEIHGDVPRPRHTGESSVLLEITPISQSADVHSVVDRVQKRSQAILAQELELDPKVTMGFAMTLSEVCQNVVEHAGSGGWVAVQTYRWQKRLGRRVAVIAVCDAGVGFRQSLESGPGWRPSDRWDDGMALEEAVIRGVSRFRDPGRGQGLAGVRKFLGRWDGKLSVRSGTARIAIVPSWDDDVPLRKHLPPLPGSQVQITIPGKAVAAR
jgi:anti-sigma regulatory factor (Ser/Thr protein kinase)